MFLTSIIVALIYLIFSICINVSWINDIACYLGYFLAIYLVVFVAIIPGFNYVFNFISLLFNKKDKKVKKQKEGDVTVVSPV